MRRALPVLLFLLAIPAEAADLRVAVMEFTNAAPAGELDTLGKGLQSMITTDLAQVPSVTLVERARLGDIRGELKLGRSGLVDGKTASQVGKLAGATHLLTGSYTVVGGKMRLDGRLFGVEDGALLLAESIEGEKDAFFELEKSLVAKIVDKLGVKLAPKQRAALAKPHTTDFEAFQRFSNGVALFDEKKYDDAVAALRAATARDADFKLAEVTLAEYQRVIAEVRGRADELETSKAQLEALEKQKGAHDETEILGKLIAIAGKKDADRLPALRALAEAYGNPDPDYHVLKLQSLEDRFALQRTADAYTQSYYAEALSAYPKFPVVLRAEPSFPKTPADLDKWLADLRTAMTKERRPEDLAWWGNVNGRPVSFFARRLHIDARGEADLHERLYDLAVKAGASPEFRIEALARLAEDHRAAGDFARSTKAWTQLAGILKDADKVRRVADEIEVDRRASEALARSPQKELLREAFMLGPHAAVRQDLRNLVDPSFVELFATKTPTPRAMARLANFRMFPQQGNNGAWVSDRYVLVGDQPVWLLQQRSYQDMTFGPRSDRFRAGEIRAFVNPEDVKGKPPIDALLVVEGVPRDKVSLRFQVDFTPAADWWPALMDAYEKTRTIEDMGVKLAVRPEVGVLFGLRDVDCVSRPMTGHLLAFDERGAHLYAIGEGDPPQMSLDKPGLARAKTVTRKSLGDVPLDLGSARMLDVNVTVGGGRVRATVNGKEVSFAVPDAQGFYGLDVKGAGYAAVRGLKAR